MNQNHLDKISPEIHSAITTKDKCLGTAWTGGRGLGSDLEHLQGSLATGPLISQRIPQAADSLTHTEFLTDGLIFLDWDLMRPWRTQSSHRRHLVWAVLAVVASL